MIPGVAAQEKPSIWPGLRLRDALLSLQVIRQAGVLSHQEASGQLKSVFLKNDRDVQMLYRTGDETMWFDLVLRGTKIDPREWWITYRGELVNLAALFSYGEEFDPAGQAPNWIDGYHERQGP